MPYTPEAYALTPVKYVGESGSIPALLLYERDGLSYLRLQTKNWPHYDGWGLWSTVGIWSGHVVTADPHEPAVADLLGELAREAALIQQYAKDRQQTNGQHAGGNGAKPPAKAPVPLIPPVSPAPAAPAAKSAPKQREPFKGGKLNGSGSPSRKSADSGIVKKPRPIRTIGGLCLQDFLGRK